MDTFHSLGGAQRRSTTSSHTAGEVSCLLHSLSLSFACVLAVSQIVSMRSVTALESSAIRRSFAKVFGSASEAFPPHAELA